MSLYSSEHRCPRDSHGLWRPQVSARPGGAWLNIKAPLYPDPQSSPLHGASSSDSSASVTLLYCLSVMSLLVLGQGLHLC